MTTGGSQIFTRIVQYQRSPFVPREAVLDNTVTPDCWMMPWRGPPRSTPPLHTTLAYVPFTPAADNTITPDNWLMRWQGPPLYSPNRGPYAPFVPKEVVFENTQTPDKWMGAFGTMPKFGVLGMRPALPFVPREATVDNTVANGWWQPLTKAAPLPPVWRTQPFFGYPYLVADNNQPTGWWQPLTKAAPRPPVWFTQPFYGFPYTTVDNNVTIDKWQQPFTRAARARLPAKTFPQFVPGGAFERVGVEWMSRWYGPTRQRRPFNTQPVFTPQVAFVDNTVTPDKWMPRWQIAPLRKPRFTQPTYTTVNFPFVAAQHDQTVDATLVTSVEVHFCGWGTTPQVADASVEQGEQSTTWTDADEQVTDYDEQDPECGS